jgi:glycosyltransferase involved in cell wall biosynthesis
MPFFSIIVPTYNRAHFLPKAIESVLSQTFEDWELVIVDDGSTDTTREVVLAYQDPRIVYIYQENQERSAARNHGISKAKGEYICFLDSDDYYLPEKLANYKRAIEEDLNLMVVFYDGLIFKRKENLIQVPIPTRSNDRTLFEFLLLNPIGPQQICCPKHLFKENNYNVNLRIGEDVELWLRLATNMDFKNISSYQTIIVEHEDRSVNLKKFNSAKEQLKQLEMIFQQYDHQQISPKVRSEVLSNCYFNSAKHFMMNKRKFSALLKVFQAIKCDTSNAQIKHRIFTLIHLLSLRIPKEYSRI